MKTRRISAADALAMDEAATCLRMGGLVAFPTETVYGLGANALMPDAVRRSYAAKGRPSDNPLIVHIWSRDQLPELVGTVPDRAARVMDAFWPGPLTIILPHTAAVPDCVTAGLPTVAVRMPSHPAALALLRRAGVPVTAPSANTSSRPSPTTAQHVLDDLDGKIDCVIDGGPCAVGVESTVLDLSGGEPAVLRPGGIPAEVLATLLGPVRTETRQAGERETPKCPGMKYKHYAPKCDMAVVLGGQAETAAWIAAHGNDRRIGVLTAGAHTHPGCRVIDGGATPEAYARALFAALRDFDRSGVELIVAEFPFGEDGISAALYNRIAKSAGGNIIGRQEECK